MTTNERLTEAGLYDAFETAVKTGDRAETVRLLTLVEFEEPAAAKIAEMIFSHPTRYGLFKL